MSLFEHSQCFVTMSRLILHSALAAVAFSLSGCCLFHRGNGDLLSASQLRSQELFAENEQLMMARDGLSQSVADLQSQQQMMAQQLNQTEQQLAAANSRVENLLAERNTIKDRYVQKLTDTVNDGFFGSGAGPAVAGFQQDEVTGLNKFPEDVLFDLGSAELRPEVMPILKEFANVVNSGANSGMRLLIVGHTDDQRIARGATMAKHPTNWHLSTDRADQVILQLRELGVEPSRMAAMGYSRFQPLETSLDEVSRQRNRRVELYIVPESSELTAWDPVRSLR